MIDSSQNIGFATGTPPSSPPVVLRPLTLGDVLAHPGGVPPRGISAFPAHISPTRPEVNSDLLWSV